MNPPTISLLLLNDPVKAQLIRKDQTILVDGLKSGDRFAFNKLYEHYAVSLFEIIIRIVKYQEPSEDVLQETFLKITRNIRQYDPEKGRLFTWLAKTARNTAIDQLRNNGERVIRGSEALENWSIQINRNYQWCINPDVMDLKTLIMSLQPKQRDVIDLIYYKGFTHSEAAETLSLPIGTVKTRLRLAIINLRRSFAVV
ncbi:hypothetical protein AQ505_16490 [Pedobacter sp. PACM 27299]|uniref:RNA polymerase sigma factor n=1 Tax=Pedobacter sp. PACM 27299 TaxID=1727164 RepID=UPI000706CD10|nr:sigma-70 family RNA polymerase sigma factor [Pedobacter sp. PACM 27299]ALL06946.1 hypothetical protein AQ505_16490 [Pedobacter sp. PACM 27299]